MDTLANTQSWPQANESDTQYFLLAIVISIALHFIVMRIIPLLDKHETKPPVDIVAELLTMAPPPPPPTILVESTPVEETPVKPIEKQVQKEPKPITTKPDPILTSKAVETSSDYVAPDTPRSAQINKESSAPVAPAPAETTSTELTAASSKNTSSTNMSTSDWSDTDLWDEYGNNLQRLCERNKKYPEIARRRGLQGLAKVAVHFSTEGKPLSVAIESSSGQASLDDQAIEMVKKSIKELPLPNKFRGRDFKITIPIDFKLDN